MPQGLEVFNDDGIYQIDGESPNLVFITKGSATGSVTFSSPAYPIVFIRPNMGRRIFLRHNGGTSYTFFCQGAFSYWVFCGLTASSGSNFGLQVFNAAGSLVYSSHSKPLKIISVRSYSRSAAWSDRWPASVPSNTTRLIANHDGILPNAQYAFAITFGAGYWATYYNNASSDLIIPLTEAFQATATGFRVYEVQPFAGVTQPLGGGNPMPNWSGPPGVVAIANVSGL